MASPRFVAGVETVRSELELGQVTLYGQSWGGMLALAYTLDHPAEVEALILSNTYAAARTTCSTSPSTGWRSARTCTP